MCIRDRTKISDEANTINEPEEALSFNTPVDTLSLETSDDNLSDPSEDALVGNKTTEISLESSPEIDTRISTDSSDEILLEDAPIQLEGEDSTETNKENPEDQIFATLDDEQNTKSEEVDTDNSSKRSEVQHSTSYEQSETPVTFLSLIHI